eukprot:TRINITY_DN43454_c0_g1_i1.p1 TRINITY_DN43454_c0_g1~~TRINITY_DN43454_c0_g1_i1.p1  ORF type:complete len:140 (-),score=19.37 TRINITY_DN43454_c0_g1_i1:105-524(-)
MNVNAMKAASAVASTDKINSFLGMATMVYLSWMALQSLIFSFSYSMYSFFAAGVIAMGELPGLLNCGPLPSIAAVMAPYKAYVYGLVSLGGILYFAQASWNLFLLAGHVMLGFLAYRCHSAQKAASSGYETLPMSTNEI